MKNLKPAFDHDLLLREEINCVTCLTVKVTEEAFLPPAEREERHGRRHADVYADVSYLRFVAEFACRSPAAGEQGTPYSRIFRYLSI